jgi:hypothetical protein
LGPQRVGDGQLDAVRLFRVSQLLLEFAERRMERRVTLAEAQDVAHLHFRVTTRSGISHGQATGNAVGRHEKIAWRVLEMGVKIEGERGVALHQRVRLRRLGARRQSYAQCNQDTDGPSEKPDCTHGVFRRIILHSILRDKYHHTLLDDNSGKTLPSAWEICQFARLEIGAQVPALGCRCACTMFVQSSSLIARLGGFEGVERRKCLKINARVF